MIPNCCCDSGGSTLNVLTLSAVSLLVFFFLCAGAWHSHATPLSPAEHLNVCMGNDWYTFPSSFFLPHNQMHLQFVKSEFTGQLPQPFSEHNGTFAQPRQPFNSLNKEEPSRYILLSSCDYVVTTVHHPPRTQVARAIAGSEGWEATISNPVIDAEHSPTLTRAFYIPRWSNVRNRCVAAHLPFPLSLCSLISSRCCNFDCSYASYTVFRQQQS